MRTTQIEWTEHTWNPFVGCSIVSAGCKNCYAMRQAYRIEAFGTVPHYNGVTEKVNGKAVWSGKLSRASDRAMNKPFTIKEPSLIFVNSMSDFFHPGASYEWMLEAIDVMRKCERHIFQILTKRPENIGVFLAKTGAMFPSNVWVGTTVEHEKTAHRIDAIRQVPAAVRFISFEPLIGGVGDVDLTGIHWAITGGESGPNARVCNPQWIRDIAIWCEIYDTPLFHKQWGSYASNPLVYENGLTHKQAKDKDQHGKGGSLLDGELIKQWPHSLNASNPVAASHRATIESTLHGSISIE
jgi:protein gp37